MQLTPIPSYKITVKNKTLDLSQPHIMGILNVTPDSFSDGGEFNDLNTALSQANQMISEGASIIDIGGESTRPKATAVSLQEELDRVIPIIEALRKRFGNELWLSIDTSHPEVMRQAVLAGADIINDVRALRRNGALEVASKLNVPVVLMHMRGEPSNMNDLAHYDDVISEVKQELQERVTAAKMSGVRTENIIIDVGFGFAKEYSHHKTLLNNFFELQELGLPIMFGTSRKRFLGEVLDKSGASSLMKVDVKERDPVGMAAAMIAVQQGACIIRTHNVGITKQALGLYQQLL